MGKEACCGGGGTVERCDLNVKISKLWCEHPRRGRVDFDGGDLEPIEAIAAVEAQARGEVIHLANTAPLIHQDVPFSYFSVNDLLNLIGELRSFPEIRNYFAARASLPADTRQTLAGERLLYEQYLLNEGGFGGWSCFEDALSERATRIPQLRRLKPKASARCGGPVCRSRHGPPLDEAFEL